MNDLSIFDPNVKLYSVQLLKRFNNNSEANIVREKNAEAFVNDFKSSLEELEKLESSKTESQKSNKSSKQFSPQPENWLG